MFPEELKKKGIIHSCYPNSGYNFKNELITFNEVSLCEGITVDYSTLFIGLNEKFNCQCGHIGCRKRILGFDQLPVIIQERYLEADLVPEYILLKIKYFQNQRS